MTFVRIWPLICVACFLFVGQSTHSVVPSLSAGYALTCVVNSVGEVKCWGATSSYYSGMSHPVPDGVVGTIDVGGPALQVSIDHNATLNCVLLQDGNVKCWGWNSSGVFSQPAGYQFHLPTQIQGLGSTAVRIRVMAGAACAVLAEGAVKCWGNNSHGQLGDGTRLDSGVPLLVQGLDAPAVDVTVAGSHGCALLETGAMRCWGEGANADRSLGARTAIPASSGVLSMSRSVWRTCATLQDETIECLDGTVGTTYALPGITTVGEVASISYGADCAIGVLGSVACGGTNTFGQVGFLGENTGAEPWHELPELAHGAVRIAGGQNHFCALMIGGGVRCWGDGATSALGLGPEQPLVKVASEVFGLPTSPRILRMANGTACATGAGTTKCWGRNTEGQLGDGTRVSRWSPSTALQLSVNPQGVALGDWHSCAVGISGQVYCWGQNLYGPLGPGSAVGVVATPQVVPGLPSSSATMVGVGSQYSCALIVAEVWCWGQNSTGQLGRTTSELTGSPPGKVEGFATAVTDLSVGAVHACAISSGQVSCWGNGATGALGNGAIESKFSATPVQGLQEAATRVVAGVNHSCALLVSGTLKCWGNNANGQLGDGTSDTSLTPVSPLLAGDLVSSIAVGMNQTCAITAQGGLKCWGVVAQPDGFAFSGSFPSPVPILEHGSGVRAVTLDQSMVSICTEKLDESVRCWGQNTFGGLGLGTAGYRPIPNIFVPDFNVWGSAAFTAVPPVSAAGDLVTLRMQIPGPAPFGTARFERNGQVVDGCAAVPISQGVATCSTTAPSGGQFTFKAIYAGDTSYPPVTLSANHVATGATTVTLGGWSFAVIQSRGAVTLGRPTFVGATNPAPTGTIRLTFPGQSCTLYLSLANPTCLISAFPSGLNQLLLAEYSGDDNYRAVTQEYRLNVVAGLDVNADGVVDSTDWLWVARYVHGFRGEMLRAGLASPNAKRSDTDIENYIAGNTTLFDVDLDGRLLGTTDMVLLSRFLNGAQSTALTGGAVGTFAFRGGAVDIRSYLTYHSQ